ncbi:uncharacterized protein EHS24_000512 [Apiotrichum porosum]|uniref:Uncharacterized protein n=1 Tax=Apiotrichum porosum TaxID=105984 RepID=A0A427YA04_9TREE|nr:uncharacterized protein EHS24_000512 [Apiotrichum porosum]RSH87989.1 hypothetical protein EHS24_000512 [Apiotrichum porosum]
MKAESTSTPPSQVSGSTAKAKKPATSKTKSWGSLGRPKKTLSSLLAMQSVEESKPRLSNISWLADVLVYSSSIIPVVMGPVVFITAFSAAVAAASVVFGKHVELTNNVVPLLSVVVGLLLVFRNSTAYERYAEGRKDFTSLIASARNLSRAIWINVVPPPNGEISREDLTQRKKDLIRLVVGFVFATKHYLRSEGGVHHADLQGLLPHSLVEFVRQGTHDDSDKDSGDESESAFSGSQCSSPRTYSGSALSTGEEELNVGLAPPPAPPNSKSNSFSFPITPNRSPSKDVPVAWIHAERKAVRRPTAVRVRRPTINEIEKKASARSTSAMSRLSTTSTVNERTPLIKSGVRQDIRRTAEDVDAAAAAASSADSVLGRMVEVGLPLVIAHEISRGLFRFRRQGNLEDVGPAGFNAMQGIVQAMIDQLGSMERIIQTPLPYVFCVHLKQCVTLYLLCLPFVLVEAMGWKMIWIVMCTAFTLCGVEGIAAQIEQPFGDDPSDLNLDLFCTELLCECEAIVERLPEGDADEDLVFVRSPMQVRKDELDGE